MSVERRAKGIGRRAWGMERGAWISDSVLRTPSPSLHALCSLRYALRPTLHAHSAAAFTLLEIMVAVALFTLVAAGTVEMFAFCNRSWHKTELHMQNTHDASYALARMVYGLQANSGLRSADYFLVTTSTIYGTWTGTNYPPAPNAPTHYLTSGGSADGSWRLTYSNAYAGKHWIDYNKKASNIVYWTDITALTSRLEVCNYVTAATATTNASGITLSITVGRREGRNAGSNSISTYVMRRNNN